MGETVNIREYIDMFRRRKWIVIITILICLAFGGYKTYKNYVSYVPTYKSKITIRINSMKSIQSKKSSKKNSDKELTDEEEEAQAMNNIYNSYSGSASATNQNIATSYIGLAKSENVKKNIAALTGLKVSQVGYINPVQSTEIPQFIDVQVTCSSKEIAKQVAEAFPEAYNNELLRVINLDCVEVVYDATDGQLIPRSRDITLLKAFAVGVVISIFLVLLAECLDTKIKTPEDVEKYWDLPLIGTIPMDDGKSKGRHAIQK